jgi:lysozyme family protein
MSAQSVACFAVVFPDEGGYQCDPKDPGNWSSGEIGVGTLIGTNMGISAPVLARYLGREPAVQDMQNLLKSSAQAIYTTEFYPPWADSIPLPLAICVVDAGVMSGGGHAARWLQQALQVPVDGIVGPKTVATANACQIEPTVHAYTDARMAYLKTLPGWGRFGPGWTTRCLHVEEVALA